MDDKLRQKLEIARTDAEYALLELRTFSLARVEIAESHIENVVARLDEIINGIDIEKRAGSRDRPN